MARKDGAFGSSRSILTHKSKQNFVRKQPPKQPKGACCFASVERVRRSRKEYDDGKKVPGKRTQQAHVALGVQISQRCCTSLHTGPGGTLSGLHICNCSVGRAKGMLCDTTQAIASSPYRRRGWALRAILFFRCFDFRRKSPQAAAAAGRRATCPEPTHPCIDDELEHSDFLQCLCSFAREVARSRALLSHRFRSLRSPKGTT